MASTTTTTSSCPPPREPLARVLMRGLGQLARRYMPMSLFWRTFLLLSLMLGAGIMGWVYTLRFLELEPRGVQAAQQIASLVNLSRAALRYTDQVNRVALVKNIAEQEAVKLQPREPNDRWEPFEVDRFTRAIGAELRSQLGPQTIVASSVNGRPGLWVGFLIETDNYWLQADPNRVQPAVTGRTTFVVMGLTFLLTLGGSALIAGLINRPLRQLSFAASRIRDGEYAERLDEDTTTREIREVNRGFNRMARELAKIEDDRAVMLAGISHDLRTPLARIRLETEMSVYDEEAKRNMAADIDQLDAIIDKFMDYARPTEVKLAPIVLAVLLDTVIRRVNGEHLKVTARVTTDVRVMADETDLDRVFANLFENARRYAQGEDGVARVSVTYARSGDWVLVSVRDEGPGVSPEQLVRLTTPFYRGDKARTHTHSTGAGLGLAIVDKTVTRMGGQLELGNAPGGGFVAYVKLRRAPTAG
ncbi:sensor histidine kinase [Sphaerotilus uruguayifluvii]|uniref:histidine kinase n=1 Tax=Sphaerotilus uruguayifluvii TaxID=2735897 RepID=A0ABX2G8A7_9BURK|nr:sensor histidine kinase [Leptothrix sp. C29]NRT57590.1 two-component system osmolarity sensor histidine kinase EnvZ [Leptothrix sp. C29]